MALRGKMLHFIMIIISNQYLIGSIHIHVCIKQMKFQYNTSELATEPLLVTFLKIIAK